MILFWGEGFLRKLAKILALGAVVAFSWGWVAHVALGRMTTRQYVNQLYADFQQGIKVESEKIRKTMERITHDVQSWGRPII